MNASELLDLIKTGETSKVQFKEVLPHIDSIAKEIVALSNSLGCYPCRCQGYYRRYQWIDISTVGRI